MAPGVVRRRHLALALAAIAAAAVPARAEVTDTTANGFTVKVVLPVAAPPETVYVALVRHVGEWWDEAHTYSGDARNLSIIAEPGGCFCEALPNGGGVQHAVVVNVAPGRLLRMVGSLGPLQEAGVTGSLSWAFDKSAGGSTLAMTYQVGGYYPGGLDKLAGPVDMVLSRQAQLLKAYAEQSRSQR